MNICNQQRRLPIKKREADDLLGEQGKRDFREFFAAAIVEGSYPAEELAALAARRLPGDTSGTANSPSAGFRAAYSTTCALHSKVLRPDAGGGCALSSRSMFKALGVCTHGRRDSRRSLCTHKGLMVGPHGAHALASQGSRPCVQSYLSQKLLQP